MKLYLSSYQYGNDFAKYLEMVGKGAEIAVIANSRDGFDESRKNARTEECMTYLGSLGLRVQEIDLRDYIARQEEVKQKLSEVKGIWILGGNAFVLRKIFHQTGLDKVLPEILKRNQLVYGGFSAAGCVLSPSLHGVELVDDEHLMSEGYQTETIWEGLGVLDYAFVPHYKSDHPESADIDKYVAYLKEHKMPHITLHDGESIIIDTPGRRLSS